MPTADTSRVQVYHVEETTWGEVPQPAPTLQALRITGESLKHKIGTTKSNEIRSDRQITDLIQNDAAGEGGINHELSYGNLDLLIEGAMFADWGTPVAILGNTDISAAATDDSFNRTTGSFVTDGVKVGQWVRVSGFTDPANNGFFKVLTVAALKITTDGTLVDETSGDSIDIEGTMIRNGVTKKSYVLEKLFSDITQFFAFTGMVVSDFSLEFAAGGIVTGACNFAGSQGVRSGATVGDGSPDPAPTSDVMNAVSNILGVKEGGTSFTGILSKLGIALKNNTRALKGVGIMGAAAIGAGQCEVTGSLSAYFEDGTLYDKFTGNQATSINFRAQDVAGNAYVFSLPKVKLSDGTIVAGGPNADVMADFTYQAIMDPTTGCTIQIDKVAA